MSRFQVQVGPFCWEAKNVGIKVTLRLRVEMSCVFSDWRSFGRTMQTPTSRFECYKTFFLRHRRYERISSSKLWLIGNICKVGAYPRELKVLALPSNVKLGQKSPSVNDEQIKLSNVVTRIWRKAKTPNLVLPEFCSDTKTGTSIR